jgi:uncharacterized protein YcnI
VRIRSPILGVAVVVVLALAPAAGAHVTLQPEEIPAGGFTRLDVRVPNEREGANTTKVEVQLPPGFLSVSHEPVPGWDTKLTMRKLDKPVEQFGEKVTEEVGRITFTGDGETGVIGPGQFQDFGLSLAVPEKPGTLTFKALQTYSNGEVVRWIGPPDSEEPAPQVKLAAAEGEAGASEPAAEQTAPAAAQADEDDSGNTLAIIALVVAIAGLLTGLAALWGRTRARGRDAAAVR